MSEDSDGNCRSVDQETGSGGDRVGEKSEQVLARSIAPNPTQNQFSLSVSQMR